MSKAVQYILLVSSLLLNLVLGYQIFSNTKTPKSSSITTVEVSRVIDGDTFLTTNNKYVRLAGLDAPEYPESCLSTDAKDKLTELITGKTVMLTDVTQDHFGRQLAYVFLDDEVFIDEILLRSGLGRLIANKNNYLPDLTKAENEAKNLKSGIWGSKCNPDSKCNIKGNYRQTDLTRIYHLPDCYNYLKIEVDQNHGDKWFCTETEAKAAGFIKSLDCPGMK